MSKILLVLLIILLLGLGIYIYKSFDSDFDKLDTGQIVKSSQVSPSPSPFLFQELTIPYLKSRNYSSNLEELKPYSSYGNYATYLTSYDSDGLRVNGLLTQPTGEKPEKGWPAIVFIHGYIPPTTYKTTSNYFDYVDYLSNRGFVVFKIDLRGHADSEGEPGGAYYSSDYIIDALNAYSALQNSGFVNPKKVGFWGHSMAGNVVLRALAVKPEIPAVSIWAGAVYTYRDFAEYGISDGSYNPPANATERQKRRKLLMDTYGQPNDGNPFWDMVAPTNYLADIDGAIQLNHAINDNVVSIQYSRNLNEILESTKIPHEFNEFQNGGHNITSPAFNSAMEGTVKFFKLYLDENNP